MDFREPKYRREVFLRFYEFHIKYKAHPGAVYYMFPYAFDTLKMTMEQKLWWCFINGCSQHVVTTYLIFSRFPNLEETTPEEINSFFRENYERFGWDTDRRYVKNKFKACIESYLKILNGRTQVEYFDSIVGLSDNPGANFDALWSEVLNRFEYFGRLSTFSYLEYLRICGLNIDCSQLFLDDIPGSKSHRNGLCKVLGRDDLDWSNDNEGVKYTSDILQWLEFEGEKLLAEAKERINDRDVSYFTLESTLCCYKGWHRENRRYPNVYNDMFFHRIKKSEAEWPEMDFSIFWQAREKYLPDYLRLESCPMDMGLVPEKQNYYRNTGQPIMMDREPGTIFGVSEKPWNRNCVLIIGACGTGKTWVMKQIISASNKWQGFKAGKFKWKENSLVAVVGDYDGTVYEGSDRLSMAVMGDFDKVKRHLFKLGKIVFFEGDRFTNSTLISKCNPLILKISGTGEDGRKKRGTDQTERHLKSIQTRVNNIHADYIFENSNECLKFIFEKILIWDIKNKTVDKQSEICQTQTEK